MRRTIEIPCDQVGLLIGRRGATVDTLCERFKVRIDVLRKPARDDDASQSATQAVTVSNGLLFGGG